MQTTQQTSTKQTTSFYRKPLPAQLVPFSSQEGKQIFTEALVQNCMSAFFPIMEQFHTQADPAFCGLGTLTMILNALGLDPNRLWKGPWRWYSEELLDCCVPLDVVKKQGITMPEFACLAKCNGAHAQAFYASESNVDEFRKAVLNWAQHFDPENPSFIATSYDRGTLKQTGSGHFSPLGGYNAQRDMVLVLDVARFKYPPYWVPLELLFASLLPVDSVTNKSRGWCVMKRKPSSSQLSLLFTLFTPQSTAASSWKQYLSWFDGKLKTLFSHVPDESDTFFTEWLKVFKDSPVVFKQSDKMLEEHTEVVQQIFEQVKQTTTFKTMQAHATSEMTCVMYSMLFLAIPKEYFVNHKNVLCIQQSDKQHDKVISEVDFLSSQLNAIKEMVYSACECSSKK